MSEAVAAALAALNKRVEGLTSEIHDLSEQAQALNENLVRLTRLLKERP